MQRLAGRLKTDTSCQRGRAGEAKRDCAGARRSSKEHDDLVRQEQRVYLPLGMKRATGVVAVARLGTQGGVQGPGGVRSQQRATVWMHVLGFEMQNWKR